MNNFKKNSIFLYFAFAAVALMLVMIVFDIVGYFSMVSNYTAQGYTKELVTEYYPFLKTTLPSIADEITSFGLLAGILFVANLLATGKTVKETEACAVHYEDTSVVSIPKAETEQPVITDSEQQ